MENGSIALGRRAVMAYGGRALLFAFKRQDAASGRPWAPIDGKGCMMPYQAGGKWLDKIGASLDVEVRTLKEVVEGA